MDNNTKYYVTFSEEIDNLVEGGADISGTMTTDEAEKRAIEYLEENDGLTGVIATFHDLATYGTDDNWAESEIESILYKI